MTTWRHGFRRAIIASPRTEPLRALSAQPRQIDRSPKLRVELGNGESLTVRHDLSPRQADILHAGGCIPWKRRQLDTN